MTEQEIINILLGRGCKPISVPKAKTGMVKYECKCGKILEKRFKDFKRRGCRYCNFLKLKQIPQNDMKPVNTKDEIWKPIEGGWISSQGRAVNSLGKELTLCMTKFRYRINGKHQYASRLVATAFEIDGYKELDSQNYIVYHVDRNPSNNRLDNLKVLHKTEAYGGFLVFAEKMNWHENKFADLEWKIVDEVPNHKIYSNGEIWNGKRFLVFSKSEGYLSFASEGKTYKVHRLVCYAFNPLPDHYCYNDYRGLQVTHKNGNKSDNHATNVEWCTNSENLQHAYSSGLNKNSKPVVQLDKTNLKFIAKYPSMATASKQTGEPEHRISLSIKGKPTPLLFKWCTADGKYYYIKEGDKTIGIPFNFCEIVIEE